ncbi:MAG: hypothetical protein FWC54_01085 [Actinomycetia bacterium]|nr:hypothetical protein [Actinomycetes bacterium]
MKKKMKNLSGRLHRQRPLVLSLTVILSIALLIGSTFAWFIQSDSRVNTFETNELVLRAVIKEDFEEPVTVKPSETVTKTVDVVNTGDVPSFARVLVLVEIVSENGELLAATPGVTYTFNDLDTSSWADGGDGYYYYLGKLSPGQTTVQPLFSSVTLASGLGPEYNNARMKVEVKLEAAEAIRATYRDGWWRNGDVPPASTALINIDNLLKDLAQ